MSFLDRLASSVVIPFTPSTYDDAMSTPLPGRYSVPVTARTAEQVPVVGICTHVVSEDVAKVALHVWESLGNDDEGRSRGKLKALEHPWYDALHHQANEFQTAIDFKEMMTAWALNRGRGVAEKKIDRRGNQLIPLHPDLVWPERTEEGPRWGYADPLTRQVRYLLPDEVLVVWGPRRMGIIEWLRRHIENMEAAQRMRGQMMTRGPRHTGVISRPKDAPRWSDIAQENFRKAIDEYMGEGERAGRPLLLQDGMTWENSGMTLAETEFDKMAQLDNALVCGAYRVPQHKAGLLERSTNNNIQQQATDYVVDCLLAWAVRWEQALQMSLLLEPFSAKLNLRTLLRGDPKTAAETHAIYYAIGTETGNEVRDDEDRNPLDGLDEPRVPLNMDIPGVANAAFLGPELEAADIRPASPAHHRALVWDAAGRIVRKETQTLAKLGDDPDGIRGFYAEHAEFVGKLLRIDDEAATAYCMARSQAVLAGDDDDPAAIIAALTDLTLAPEGAVA